MVSFWDVMKKEEFFGGFIIFFMMILAYPALNTQVVTMSTASNASGWEHALGYIFSPFYILLMLGYLTFLLYQLMKDL